MRYLLIFLGMATASAFAAETRIEIEHRYMGANLGLGKTRQFSDTDFHLTRLDWLISDLDFKKESGEWLESENWAEYLSLEDQRNRAVIHGLPDGKYTAIRFLVGLNPTLNGANENEIPPGNPLHPVVNGLHWGWSDGYIFAAVEGRFGDDDEGFSYHLATSGNAVEVVIPLTLESPRQSTIRLGFDLAAFFKYIQPGRDATSSHSRGEDPLIAGMRSGVEEGFSLLGISSDKYQQPTYQTGEKQDEPLIGTPYQLAISERLPTFELPADNPLTHEGVALGEALFFNKQLSGNNTQSCADCHQPDVAFVDKGRALSIGSRQLEGKRNSMPLFNLGWHERFFWDGRASTLRQQVLIPIEDPLEMDQDLPSLLTELSADAGTVELFEAAFGTAEINESRLAKALEQYLLTLIAQDSKFDRAARGDMKLTAQEQQGLRLFVTEYDPEKGLYGADCFHCHGGNLFTNRRFTNNGLPPLNSDFEGLYAVTGKEVDRGKFKTPSLRNVAVTAPYMHDGRFATLEEVVDHYSSGVDRSKNLDPNLAKHPVTGIQLSEDNKAALVAFLRTLTDIKYLQ